MRPSENYQPIQWEKEFGMTKEEYDAWERAEGLADPEPLVPTGGKSAADGGARLPCARHEDFAPCACDVALSEKEFPDEGEEKFRAALEKAKRAIRPRGMMEEILVETIVLARWRLKRAVRAERGYLMHMGDSNNYYDSKQNEARAPVLGDRAFDEARRMPHPAHASHVERYRANAQRDLFRALAELRALQRERRRRKENKKRERALTAERVRRHRERKRAEKAEPKDAGEALQDATLTPTEKRKNDACNAVFEKTENTPEPAESGKNATSAPPSDTTAAAGDGRAPLPSPHLGVEGVAQPVAEQIERKDRRHDGKAGERDNPPALKHHGARGVEHQPPLDVGRLRPQPKEGQPRRVENRRGEAERGLHDKR